MMDTTDTHDPDGGWRELAEGLHGLRAEPPATLAPAVLERVGLTDAYLRVDGPAGPLLVAYNGRGISATAPGADEARFLERLGYAPTEKSASRSWREKTWNATIV